MNVQDTVKTSSLSWNTLSSFESWNTLSVADVNAMSVMFSVRFGFGHEKSGLSGEIGVTGGSVSVVIVTFPFLMPGEQTDDGYHRADHHRESFHGFPSWIVCGEYLIPWRTP